MRYGSFKLDDNNNFVLNMSEDEGDRFKYGDRMTITYDNEQ